MCLCSAFPDPITLLPPRHPQQGGTLSVGSLSATLPLAATPMGAWGFSLWGPTAPSGIGGRWPQIMAGLTGSPWAGQRSGATRQWAKMPMGAWRSSHRGPIMLYGIVGKSRLAADGARRANSQGAGAQNSSWWCHRLLRVLHGPDLLQSPGVAAAHELNPQIRLEHFPGQAGADNPL